MSRREYVAIGLLALLIGGVWFLMAVQTKTPADIQKEQIEMEWGQCVVSVVTDRSIPSEQAQLLIQRCDIQRDLALDRAKLS